MPSTTMASPAAPWNPEEPAATSEATTRAIEPRAWIRLAADRHASRRQTAEQLVSNAAPNAIIAAEVRIDALTPSSANTPSTIPATPTRNSTDKLPPLEEVSVTAI